MHILLKNEAITTFDIRNTKYNKFVQNAVILWALLKLQNISSA